MLIQRFCHRRLAFGITAGRQAVDQGAAGHKTLSNVVFILWTSVLPYFDKYEKSK